MNKDMLRIVGASDLDRQSLFNEMAAKMKTSAELIEKDFWVCVVLDVLFNEISPGCQSDDPLFLFKGGTSLSKCFDKVDRFSEDIDIVVSRQFLGFSGENDPIGPEYAHTSNKKQRKDIDSLAAACSNYFKDELKAKIEGVLPNVDILFDDNDETTLLVKYPSAYTDKGEDYIQKTVKIEGGAKSAVTPSVISTVKPYIANADLVGVDLEINGVNAILPERTFLDKLLILHGWNIGVSDDPSRLPVDKNRLSRHYYDVARLWESDLKSDILSMTNLLESVRKHNIDSGFARGWMKTKDASFETLDIVPNSDLEKVLSKDYKLMVNTMMFGDIPSFDSVIASISDMDNKMRELYPRYTTQKPKLF